MHQDIFKCIGDYFILSEITNINAVYIEGFARVFVTTSRGEIHQFTRNTANGDVWYAGDLTLG